MQDLPPHRPGVWAFFRRAWKGGLVIVSVSVLAAVAGTGQPPTGLFMRGYSLIPAPRNVSLQPEDVEFSSAWALRAEIAAGHAATRSLTADLEMFHAVRLKAAPAGADRVVIPHEIGGKRLALACLRPNVVDFMTMESSGGKLGLSIEEIEVPAGSPVAGQSLKHSDFRAKYGVTVVGIKKQSGDLELDPSGDIVIETGDILVLIGKSDALENLGSLSRV